MSKYKIFRFDDENPIQIIEITRETAASYWTKGRRADIMHRKSAEPCFDTFDEAKREWIGYWQGRVNDAKNRIKVYTDALERDTKKLNAAKLVTNA